MEQLLAVLGNFANVLAVVVLIIVSWNPLKEAVNKAVTTTIAWAGPSASWVTERLAAVAPVVAMVSLGVAGATVTDAVFDVQRTTITTILELQRLEDVVDELRIQVEAVDNRASPNTSIFSRLPGVPVNNERDLLEATIRALASTVDNDTDISDDDDRAFVVEVFSTYHVSIP